MLTSKRCQISFEYLTIMGFTMIVLVILISVSFSYSKDIDDQIALNQVDRVTKSIVDNAESVFYFGEPSRVKITAYIPKQVKSIVIYGKEIVFTLSTAYGDTDLFKVSDVNLTGSISPAYGYHNIVIESRGSYVWINST